MTAVEFLESSRSNHLFYGTKIQQQSFWECAKKVENRDGKRTKDIKFSEIEDKLISYAKLRANNYKRDKCGTSWLLVREKCVKWAVDLDIKIFRFSDR